MSGANLYLLGRHLTKGVTNSPRYFEQTPDYSPSLNHSKDTPSIIKINIPNSCRNYRADDFDSFFSAMESHVEQVSIGSDFLLIMLSDGALYSMGINRPTFHLGITTIPLDSFADRSVFYLNYFKERPVKMISSGGFYSVVATRDEELYGIGSNDYGQFSVYNSSTHKNNATPLRIDYGKKEGDRITHITCCFSFSVVIINDTDMRVAGQDWISEEGQVRNLVNSRHIMSNLFFKFPSPVLQIKSGAFHVVILLKNGRVFSCGSNSRDQLGPNYNSNRKGVQEIFLENPIGRPIGISCGSDFSLFLTKNGIDRLGSSRYAKFDACLFRDLESFTNGTDIQMCEQLISITSPEAIHLRGNNSTFTLGEGEDEFYELNLKYNDIFNTHVSHELVGVSARYYHIAFFLRHHKQVARHFIFIKRRVDCKKLSDIAIKSINRGVSF